jgi:hypothetical protein
MNAVWSFWTKPYLAERCLSWRSDRHHWLAWGLSVYVARQHYPHTQLVTDEAGARILVDELELPFESVSTALDTLAAENPNWWALGKLEAYRRQKSAFIHLDTDVFLWQPLAPEFAGADVIAQNPEFIEVDRGCYCPGEFERWIGWPEEGWLRGSGAGSASQPLRNARSVAGSSVVRTSNSSSITRRVRSKSRAIARIAPRHVCFRANICSSSSSIS